MGKEPIIRSNAAGISRRYKWRKASMTTVWMARAATVVTTVSFMARWG
jgi:hypothetical protein